MIPILSVEPARQRKREQTKGRQVDAAVLAEVQGWLGAEPPQRERLVEYLHLINDRQRCLPAPHLAALAQLMRLSQAEVFEVASFYHHFEIVKGDADGLVPAAPALTVRICDGLVCEMAGARELLARLPALLGGAVRVIAA
ncbi:MAG: NAD(P)H-dependent oxidoreductase subunit E, partial [Rubrivivax sp.]|nr:NAD(P)H-dependent oxidoreductase subunit E [Rubrivivax sp.]